MEAGERKEEWKRAEIEILCCRLEGQRIPGNRAIPKILNAQNFKYTKLFFINKSHL